MCICDYVTNRISTFQKCFFRFEWGYKRIIALGRHKTHFCYTVIFGIESTFPKEPGSTFSDVPGLGLYFLSILDNLITLICLAMAQIWGKDTQLGYFQWI